MNRFLALAALLVGLTAVPVASAAQTSGSVGATTIQDSQSPMPSAAQEQGLVNPGSGDTMGAMAFGLAARAPYCKTSYNHGTDNFAGSPAATLSMSVYWCHLRGAVSGTPSPMWNATTDGFVSGLFFKFNHYDDPQYYFYNYAGRGTNTGYALKRRAYFDGCLDPLHAICLNHFWIEIHTYVHGDGTVYTSQQYGK